MAKENRPKWISGRQPNLSLVWAIPVTFDVRLIQELEAKDALGKYLVDVMRSYSGKSDTLICRLYEEWERTNNDWKTSRNDALYWRAWIEVKHGEKAD